MKIREIPERVRADLERRRSGAARKQENKYRSEKRPGKGNRQRWRNER